MIRGAARAPAAAASGGNTPAHRVHERLVLGRPVVGREHWIRHRSQRDVCSVVERAGVYESDRRPLQGVPVRTLPPLPIVSISGRRHTAVEFGQLDRGAKLDVVEHRVESGIGRRSGAPADQSGKPACRLARQAPEQQPVPDLVQLGRECPRPAASRRLRPCSGSSTSWSARSALTVPTGCAPLTRGRRRGADPRCRANPPAPCGRRDRVGPPTEPAPRAGPVGSIFMCAPRDCSHMRENELEDRLMSLTSG